MNIPFLSDQDIKTLIEHIQPVVDGGKKLFELSNSAEVKSAHTSLSTILDKLQRILLSK